MVGFCRLIVVPALYLVLAFCYSKQTEKRQNLHRKHLSCSALSHQGGSSEKNSKEEFLEINNILFQNRSRKRKFLLEKHSENVVDQKKNSIEKEKFHIPDNFLLKDTD